MPVMREELVEKKALYEVHGKEGVWAIHKGIEHPTIQLVHMETSEIFDMRMDSIHNIRCRKVGELEEGQSAPEPIQVVEKPVEVEVIRTQIASDSEAAEALAEAQEEIEQLRLMIIDASVIMGELVQVDRPKKALKAQAQSWFDQSVEIADTWGIEHEQEPEEPQQ